VPNVTTAVTDAKLVRSADWFPDDGSDRGSADMTVTAMSSTTVSDRNVDE